MFLDKELNIVVFQINNTVLDAIGDLTEYTTIQWPTAFIGCGSFELTAPITDYNRELLQKGNLLWDGSKTGAIIECIKSVVNEDGSKSYDVKGRTLEKFLKERIIWGTLLYYNKKASTIMYNIVNKNCINPTNQNRKIPWLINATDTFIGNTIDSYQKTGGEVYDALESLATDSDIGFSIYLDINLKKMVFTVEAGTDRTLNNQSGNDPVIFETSLQDILSSSYYTNDEDLKTVAFVQGEDTGEQRKSVTVGIVNGVGLNRRELYVDARDIQSNVYDDSGQSIQLTDEEYLQVLSQRGIEKLAEYITVETFEAQIRQFGEIQYEYGEDFFLGDKVTVIDEELGVMVSARVIKVEEDMSDNYEIVLSFGYSYPTILKKVKREIT